MPAARAGACGLAMLAFALSPWVHGADLAAAPDSLYARLGGAAVVTAFVAETLDRTVADPKLRRSFEGSNLRRIKRLFAEQVCAVAGGGCVYSGDPMREVHANHHITEAEFYGVVAILRSSMRHHGVALRERNELLALLAPMKRDIVEPFARAPLAAR